MKKTFYSNGKLLITGEYAVLDGTKALALPTAYGQSLEVEEDTHGGVQWNSFDSDGSNWLNTNIPLHAILEGNGYETAETSILVNILHQAHQTNPAILENSGGFTITTRLTFPRRWGLGTSSTLINNIAMWFGIDPYALLKASFGGSGYDIACAQNNTAIVYQLENGQPIVHPVTFEPAFSDNLYFVYLNQKRNSREAIANYREHQNDIEQFAGQVSQITDALLNVQDVKSFSELLERHETLVSNIVKMPTVKESTFPDFPGTIKSLGAWGGDFVMAVSENDPTDYFSSKGYATVIPYNRMILK